MAQNSRSGLGASLPQVPKTLREAIEELHASRRAREAFGEDVLDHYLYTYAALLEQQAFDQPVPCWQPTRNFERN